MDSGDSNNGNNIGERGPMHGHIPIKIDRDDTQQFQCTVPMPVIDVTDGLWHPLQFYNHGTAAWSSSPVAGKGEAASYTVSSFWELKFSDLLGVPFFGLPVTNSTDQNALWSYGSSDILQYAYIKPKMVEMNLSNFLVTVERDTSGGIQFKDDVRFEVQCFPSTGLSVSGGIIQDVFYTNYPSSVFITDFKEGIKTVNTIDCGWFPYSSARVSMRINNTGNVGRTYYPSMYEWFSNEIIDRKNTDTSWQSDPPPLWGNPQLTSPAYYYAIRAINIPKGLTNVKIYLSYVSTLTSTIAVSSKMQLSNQVLSEGADYPISSVMLNETLKANKTNKRRRVYLQ